MLGGNQRSIRKRVNAESLFEIAHGVAEGRGRQSRSLQNKSKVVGHRRSSFCKGSIDRTMVGQFVGFTFILSLAVKDGGMKTRVQSEIE